MKKNHFKIVCCFVVLFIMVQKTFAQNGIGTSQPNKATLLDLSSSSKGILIPRIALTSASTFAPISGGTGFDSKTANSLLVYNTATATGLTPGYYYWTESATQTGTWNRLQMSDDPTSINLSGDVTGDPTSNTLTKLQNADYDVKGANNGDIIVWNSVTSKWIAKSPFNIPVAQSLTSNDFSITAPNGNLALLKALVIDIKNNSITTVKINTGTTPAGQILVADGSGGIIAGNVSLRTIGGTFPTVAQTGVQLGVSTANIFRARTGASITLPPGKWMIFVGSTVKLRSAANGAGTVLNNNNSKGLWVVFYFTNTPLAAGTTTGDETVYVAGVGGYSGRRAGATGFPYRANSAFVEGVFSIENTSSSSQSYYLNYTADTPGFTDYTGNIYLTDAFRDTNDANRVEDKYLFAVPVS